jgi:hypothetical protein
VAFDLGETAHQQVAFAPTWIAHPAITEEETRRIEPDEDRWLREFGAVPFEGSDAGVFAPLLLDRATRDALELPKQPGHHYVAWMDPGMRGNAWTFGIATNVERGDDEKRAIVLLREWIGTRAKPLDPFAVLGEIGAICERYGVPAVTTDGYQFDALAPIALRAGITLHLDSLTAAKKLDRYEGLQARLADGRVELPPHAKMRTDLLSVRRRLTASGFAIDLVETPDGRHADFAPTVAGLLDFTIAPPPRTTQPKRYVPPTVDYEAEGAEIEARILGELDHEEMPWES